jgi:hypothetical protein
MIFTDHDEHHVVQSALDQQVHDVGNEKLAIPGSDPPGHQHHAVVRRDPPGRAQRRDPAGRHRHGIEERPMLRGMTVICSGDRP